MIRRWGNFISCIGRLLRPKPDRADRSRLMGMYLDQANRPRGARVRSATSKERQDGKFAQIRGRGVERLP